MEQTAQRSGGLTISGSVKKWLDMLWFSWHGVWLKVDDPGGLFQPKWLSRFMISFYIAEACNIVPCLLGQKKKMQLQGLQFGIIYSSYN